MGSETWLGLDFKGVVGGRAGEGEAVCCQAKGHGMAGADFGDEALQKRFFDLTGDAGQSARAHGGRVLKAVDLHHHANFYGFCFSAHNR